MITILTMIINIHSSQAAANQGKQRSSAKSFSPGFSNNHDYDDHDDEGDHDDHDIGQVGSCLMLLSTEPSDLL